MLEHQKIVLQGVSNDSGLFKKELIKSLAWLSDEEQTELRKWAWDNFHDRHADIIFNVFYNKMNVAS